VKPSTRIRQLAAVLVVVFVLTTVWAAYYLYAETHELPSSASGTSIATYSENSVGGFAAAVRPSYLYNNSTEVYGGDTNLFTPITSWINSSITYTLEANRTAAISLVETFTVTLSTPAWSKPLFSSFNNTSLPAATTATLASQYSLNVSSVVALATAIDAQLGYYGSEYTVSLEPVISGSVEVAGIAETVALVPQLNYTFDASLITPSGLSYTSTGSLADLSSSASGGGVSMVVPYIALVGSIGGVGSSAWVATRRTDEERIPPLDDIIRPYEEAIATVSGYPEGVTSMAVPEFADLVKIADTLGKPVLRPAGPDPVHPMFFVLDGPNAFTYRYPGDGRAPPPSEDGTHLLTGPRWSPVTAVLVERLQQEVQRLHGLSLDAAIAAEARRRVSRAMDLIRLGEEAGAAAEIEELSRLLSADSDGQRPPQ
jgi:hypothetical protein